MSPNTTCVTAQLPNVVYDKLVKLNEKYPGMSRQAMVKVAIALLLEADDQTIQSRLGRY